MDKSAIRTHVDRLWDDSVVGELVEYIRIPNKSVAFDRDWKAHGHMDRVVARFEDWARRQPIRGMKLEVVRLEGRTPLLFIEIPGDSKDCVLLYGHMDKQPEMSGWREGLGPWSPVIEGDRLYGRGSADDGYATFACLGAISCAAGELGPACAMRRRHRGVRRERQLRSPSLYTAPRRSHRAAEPVYRARFRMRQLRSAMADDFAARPGRRQAPGRSADRGRALRRRGRRRARQLPHRAPVAEPGRRRGDRQGARAGVPRQNSRSATQASGGHRRRNRRRHRARSFRSSITRGPSATIRPS